MLSTSHHGGKIAAQDRGVPLLLEMPGRAADRPPM